MGHIRADKSNKVSQQSTSPLESDNGLCMKELARILPEMVVKDSQLRKARLQFLRAERRILRLRFAERKQVSPLLQP